MWSLYSHTNTNQLKLHLIMPFPKPLVQICIHNPYAERQWNISKQRNCHVNLIICFFAVEINGSPKGCQTEMFVLFLPLSVPLFNLFLWSLLLMSLWVTHAWSAFPSSQKSFPLGHYLTISFKYEQACSAPFLTKILNYKTGFHTPNMQLVVLGAVVNSLWRAVSGRRESEKERKEKKREGGRCWWVKPFEDL